MLPESINRRTFLAGSGVGLGHAALMGLLNAEGRGGSRPSFLLPKARAKRVIFLCMAGGPSHLETFDYKPKLDEMNGKPMPDSFTKGQPIAQLQGKQLKVQGHLTKFKRHGQGGQYISDFAINGRPSMGAWVNYGLGSETKDLPGFVVLTSVGGRNPQPIASRQWGAGFLPSRHQGVEFNSSGDPVHYVRRPANTSAETQQRVVETVNLLDRYGNRHLQDPEVATRIAAYEMAFRMQTSVPELMDISREPKHVLEMYGAKPGDGTYASNCLLARRLAERGVRFIHLYHRGWDHHGGLVQYMNKCCGLTDKPTWALIQDLKQRDMLKDTLVVWGGEFGRTPMFQGKGGAGRDHHIKGFSMWMAGGGVKGGVGHGATDELGYNAEQDIVHVRDLHATMLHLLGINHELFTVKHQGLDSRLTGVEKAHVVRDVLA
jgi:hypothetical protein